jgi:hypothetical protein
LPASCCAAHASSRTPQKYQPELWINASSAFIIFFIFRDILIDPFANSAMGKLNKTQVEFTPARANKLAAYETV